MPVLNIHKSYILKHPRDTIFDLWVSPDATISPVTAIEVDAQSGGSFILIVDGEHELRMTGKFLEFVRPEKLVYTWEWNQDGEVSQVQVDFNSIDAGTEVVIQHTGFDKESSRETHDSGWDAYIAGIRQLL